MELLIAVISLLVAVLLNRKLRGIGGIGSASGTQAVTE